MNTIFYISMSFIKVVKNEMFKKSSTSHEANLTLLFLSFSLTNTQNQSEIIKYLAVEQRQDQDKVRHVWSIGVISFVFWEIQIWTQVIWNNFTKKRQNKVDFQGVIFNFSKKKNVFLLPPYAWLESYGPHGSFGTKISGSLIVSPVLWVLSSRNTLSVTHSYTAS